MQVIKDLTRRQPTPAVLTIGSFDGLHIGHQLLIRDVVKSARNRGIPAVVMTFEPSPREVLRPDQPLAYLTRLPQKLYLLEQLGVDETIVMRFTKKLSRMEAPDFLAWVRRYLPFVELWEGEGFALGHGRTGNMQVLARLGEEMGYDLKVSPLVMVGNLPASSTRVREALMGGDIETAQLLLGRYPTVPGTVVPGSRRGRELGYPTANLALPPNQALPADGVYAAWVWRPSTGQMLHSVTSVGTRPMFEDDARLVEAHILNFNEDIYGESLTVHFVKFLRGQERFSNLGALINQMDADSRHASTILSKSITPAYKF